MWLPDHLQHILALAMRAVLFEQDRIRSIGTVLAALPSKKDQHTTASNFLDSSVPVSVREEIAIAARCAMIATVIKARATDDDSFPSHLTTRKAITWFNQLPLDPVELTLVGFAAVYHLLHVVTAYGDLVDAPAPEGQFDVGTHQPLLIRFRDESSGVRAIRDFVSWAKANKVSAFATYPNTLYFSQYQTYPAFLEIRNFYRSLGVEVIGEPQDAMFSSDLLSDTIYHLSGRGIEIRTDKLVHQLEADHVFMTWVEAARR